MSGQGRVHPGGRQPKRCRSEFEQAKHNRTLIMRRIARAVRLPNRHNELTIHRQMLANIDKLLARTFNPNSTRNVAFNSFEDLVIDGDWIVNMDGGEEYCISCARKILLLGDFDPDSANPYLLSVGTPDESEICCYECEEPLYVIEYPDVEQPDMSGFAHLPTPSESDGTHDYHWR
jgi:hypothetical protein